MRDDGSEEGEKMKVFLRVMGSMLDKRYKTKIAFLHHRNQKYYTDVFISNAVKG